MLNRGPAGNSPRETVCGGGSLYNDDWRQMITEFRVTRLMYSKPLINQITPIKGSLTDDSEYHSILKYPLLWIKFFTLSTLVNSPSFLGPFQMAVSQTLKAQHRYAFWPWYPDEYRWRSHISQVKGHPNYFGTSEVPARTKKGATQDLQLCNIPISTDMSIIVLLKTICFSTIYPLVN